MPSPRPSNAARTLYVSGAAIATLASIALLAVAAFSFWGNAQKDDQGYVSTDHETISTTSYALTSDDLTIDAGAPHWLVDHGDYGKVRLSAQSHDGKPVFVGIAHTSDVKRYLAGTAHATVTDFESRPFRVRYEDHRGAGTPVPPVERSIWAASTHGTGTQQLRWDVADGSWSVVIMNADGSRGVAASVSAGAKLPFLVPLAWSSIGGGLALLLAAGGLLYLGVRAPRVPPARPVATPATPAAV
jgi:hypothetical protein